MIKYLTAECIQIL